MIHGEAGAERRAHADGLWRLHAWYAASAMSLLLAGQHAFRSYALYLAPAGATRLALVAAFAGAAAGLFALRAVAPFRHQALRASLFVVALALTATSFAPFVAFDAGTWAPRVAAGCLFATALSLTTAALCLPAALGREALALGLVPFLLGPTRVPTLLLAALLVEVAVAHAGFLRSGPFLGALVALLGASYPSVQRLLHERPPSRAHGAWTVVVTAAALATALAAAQHLVPASELARFPDEIVFATRTENADYAVVASPGGYELFADGQLAISSLDEPRRTAALVAPVLAAASRASTVLLLQAGYGMVERDVLSDARVKRLTAVSPDAARSLLARRLSFLSTRLSGALDSKRLESVVADPLVWLGAHPGARFDVVIADFPWPLGYREGKLYTHHVFALLAAQLAEGGLLVVPGGSGFAAPEALGNVTATLASAGLRTAAYHVAVPTLGVASFVVASWRPVDPAGLRVAFPGLDAGLDLVTTGRGQAATLHAQTVLQAFDDARARR